MFYQVPLWKNAAVNESIYTLGAKYHDYKMLGGCNEAIM